METIPIHPRWRTPPSAWLPGSSWLRLRSWFKSYTMARARGVSHTPLPGDCPGALPLATRSRASRRYCSVGLSLRPMCTPRLRAPTQPSSARRTDPARPPLVQSVSTTYGLMPEDATTGGKSCRSVRIPSGSARLPKGAGAQCASAGWCSWRRRHEPCAVFGALLARQSLSSPKKANSCSTTHLGRSSGIQCPHPSAMPPRTSSATRLQDSIASIPRPRACGPP
jgi:hypothetical protein